MLINIIDIIEFLTGSGNVPSPIGPMLEKVRDGTSGTFGNSGKNNEEYRILAKASILRCVDGLRKIEKIDFESCPSLRAFAKKTNVIEGSLVLAVISAYHQWYLKSEERGLVEVYRLMQKLDPTLPDPSHDEESLHQSFRLGKTRKAREKSAKLLKDSLLVVDAWINKWNDREIEHSKKNRKNVRRA